MEAMRAAEGGQAMALQAARATIADKDKALASQETELKRAHLEHEQQQREQQRMGEELAAKGQALSHAESEIARLQLVDEAQDWELEEAGTRLAVAHTQNARLSKEARPGVEVVWVDEGVTRIEGAGEGEPAAKRLKVVEESSARSFAGYADLLGQHSKVKQVPARGPRSLISQDRTPRPLKCAGGPLSPFGFNSPNIAQRHALHVERTAERTPTTAGFAQQNQSLPA